MMIATGSNISAQALQQVAAVNHHVSASTITGKTLVDCLTLLPTSAHHLSILLEPRALLSQSRICSLFSRSQLGVVAGLDECVVLPAA